MSQQPTPSGREIINYDGVWGDGAASRLYHVGDGEHRISLGRNGVSQSVLIYALSGVGLAFVVHRLPLLSTLVAQPSWWLWALVLAVVFGLAAKVRPDGLAMHVYLPVLLADLTGPRHHFGWVACDDPETSWQPDELVIEETPS